MDNIDFSKITACGENCTGCNKKEIGECEGCLETSGKCKEWKESNVCPVAMCAKTHEVQFCGLCKDFPCNLLTTKITWNSNVVEQQKLLAAKYFQQKQEKQANINTELWDAYKDITISQLTVKDLSQLLTLFKYNDEQEMLCENTKLLKNHSIDIFGLFCDGQIIGELRVKYTDIDARISIPDKRAYLYAFRVLNDFQGKGLGKYLLSTVLQTLYAKSYSEFTIGVENDNMTAKYIYEKFGFERKIATLKEDYQGDEYSFDLLLKK